jgi:hypothetical protein
MLLIERFGCELTGVGLLQRLHLSVVIWQIRVAVDQLLPEEDIELLRLQVLEHFAFRVLLVELQSLLPFQIYCVLRVGTLRDENDVIFYFGTFLSGLAVIAGLLLLIHLLSKILKDSVLILI